MKKIQKIKLKDLDGNWMDDLHVIPGVINALIDNQEDLKKRIDKINSFYDIVVKKIIKRAKEKICILSIV